MIGQCARVVARDKKPKQRGISLSQTKNEIDLAEITQNLSTDEQYLSTLEQRERELTSTGSDRGTDVSIANYSRLRPNWPAAAWW